MPTNEYLLQHQYRNATNLQARIALHPQIYRVFCGKTQVIDNRDGFYADNIKATGSVVRQKRPFHILSPDRLAPKTTDMRDLGWPGGVQPGR